MHHNPTDAEIRSLLTKATTIAMVGASSNPERASYGVMRRLQRVGYRVIPINPRETEILGERVYPALSAIDTHVDIVDVFRREEFTPAIATEAVAIKAGALWLQLGVHNEEAAAIATAGGLVVVTNMCIAVAHSLFSVPVRRAPL
ncbi:MAG: CoA-binding protein [Vicinamibacterales bacterium]